MDLLEQYRRWRSMAEAALSAEVVNAEPVEVEGLAFVGMGGSGIVGDFASSLMEGAEVPSMALRGLDLPRWVGRRWLVVAISYSGGTLETVSVAHEAILRGARVAVVSSGGGLLELARGRGLPHVRVEGGYAPRAAMPAMLYATLRLLSRLGFEGALEGAEEGLRVLEGGGAEEEGRRLSKFLEGSVPLVVADQRFAPLAWRFKSELSENAKVPAKFEVVPESMHNDVEAYAEAAKSFRAVVLSAGDDTAYTRMLEGFVAELMEEVGLEAAVVRLRGEGRLAKLLYGSHVAGFASVHLALGRGVRPESTELIKRYRGYLESSLRPRPLE
ncbi:MAG: SIS domain-containing protein [Candidatus Nezhaarchaeales archaeon]